MTNEIYVISRDLARSGGTWYVGTVGGTHFEALVFGMPSEDYGFQGGKVSTVAIGKMDSNQYTAFSRGFYDGGKPTGELKEKFDAVIARYNA